ncbi:MAG: dynamin family protein, partial [Verrucomicrobia bacterium]|nr:dynamin family protein [Verrucomicrobiota bacterium]
MFGERYFATRKRLVRVAESIRRLAGETGYALNGFASDGELLQGLKNPFLFVVCGEVNAGKSTLINGLFGANMCEVNILPQTDRVLWYRHGVERNVEATEVLEERYRDIDFLQDFNIVDTPGTNSVMRGHQAITERFLPVADLVLFVFPVSNPWGAATWDFIAKLPGELEGRVAFILQQKDLRDEDELRIIKDHMGQLARQKLGEEPEVFAVSGRMAMQAKGQEPFEERLWRESGYPALEDFISKVVTESPGRRQVLRNVRDAASEALEGIETQIEGRSKEVEG